MPKRMLIALLASSVCRAFLIWSRGWEWKKVFDSHGTGEGFVTKVQRCEFVVS